MKNTKIEWAHHTVNFWWGCVKVSLACMYCYAEVLAKLFSKGKASWGPTGNRWVRDEAARRELYALDKALVGTGRRERVFINSMSDTFEDREDLREPRERLWDACNNVSNLDILLLTKRPENVMPMVPLAWHTNWPAHVWIGTTVENQEMADVRVPILLAIPAPVRFLSCEPLLGPVDLTAMDRTSDSDPGYSALELRDGDEGELTGTIAWVICGGESGGHARPMHAEWARSLREQCAEAGVPFFFKQWGEWVPFIEPIPADATLVEVSVDGRKRRFVQSGQSAMVRIGKADAGRLLDGKEHSAVPEVGA